MTTATASNTFLQRLIGAMALDRAIYEEVEADRTATTQAFLVVLASSLAAGIGAREPAAQSWSSVLFYSIVALLGWASWALLVFQVGTRLIPEVTTRSNVGELLRTLGFATTPGLLRILGVMPAVMMPVFIATTLWMLAAMIVAVRQALDYRSTWKAIAVCVLGLALAMTMALIIGIVFAPAVR